MVGIFIRQEKEVDYPEVYQVNSAAFNQEAEAKLVVMLRKSDAFIPELSLVATSGNEIIGHILFTKITISNGKNRYESLALAPMAVLPEFQNKGVGSELVKQGLTKAKALGFSSVIVLGHENFYPKFGFKQAENWQIKAPFEVPSEAFMALELLPGALKNISGTVVYPKEFQTVT